jgi:hypothetical protein
MVFNFTKDEFDMLVKYGDFEDLEYPYKLFTETNQIEIGDNDISMFQCIISDISVVYGMDEDQNNMTDFGYKALDIYDKVYWQIKNAKAPT